MPSQEDIARQLELLETHRRTLAHLLKQRAGLGRLFAPPALANGIDDARGSIRTIKGCLKQWGVTVDDHPNDEEFRKERVRSKHHVLYIVVGLVLIAMVIVAGFFMIRNQKMVDEYDARVDASQYPFAPTNAYIEKGNIVEVIVQGNDTSWYCFSDTSTDYKGIAEIENRKHTISPSANFCELIGYIDNGPILPIGTHPKFVADRSGLLYLGANDSPPANCGFPDQKQCFLRNKGQLFVRITVNRANNQ